MVFSLGGCARIERSEGHSCAALIRFFVFTLTGSEVPQQMKVTVYTITGNVIREVFLSELGNLHIGNNITQFAWDGTDQYGDKLANGLYFYKVETILDGKHMDHYDNGTDNYFKRGIGKMYLMR